MREPWKFYNDYFMLHKWVPSKYGDERDGRENEYGDKKEGEDNIARLIGFNKPYRRVEYEVDGEIEDCTLQEILNNLYSKGKPRGS